MRPYILDQHPIAAARKLDIAHVREMALVCLAICTEVSILQEWSPGRRSRYHFRADDPFVLWASENRENFHWFVHYGWECETRDCEHRGRFGDGFFDRLNADSCQFMENAPQTPFPQPPEGASFAHPIGAHRAFYRTVQLLEAAGPSRPINEYTENQSFMEAIPERLAAALNGRSFVAPRSGGNLSFYASIYGLPPASPLQEPYMIPTVTPPGRPSRHSDIVDFLQGPSDANPHRLAFVRDPNA
jgi:hypothetical protein